MTGWHHWIAAPALLSREYWQCGPLQDLVQLQPHLQCNLTGFWMFVAAHGLAAYKGPHEHSWDHVEGNDGALAMRTMPTFVAHFGACQHHDHCHLLRESQLALVSFSTALLHVVRPEAAAKYYHQNLATTVQAVKQEEEPL